MITISGRYERTWGIKRNYRHTTGAGVSLHLSRYFGVSVRRMRGGDDRMCLVLIGWYPLAVDRLGYRQASYRSF